MTSCVIQKMNTHNMYSFCLRPSKKITPINENSALGLIETIHVQKCNVATMPTTLEPEL